MSPALQFIRVLTSSLFIISSAAIAAAPPDGDQAARLLHWQRNDSPCGGFFAQTSLDFPYLGLIKRQDSDIRADSVSLTPQGQSRLSGHVRLRRPGFETRADDALILRQGSPPKITRIDLHHHVIIRQPGRLFVVKSAQYQPDLKRGSFTELVYRFARGKSLLDLPLDSTDAWGVATSGKQVGAQHYIFNNASYTTCPPHKPLWQVTAKRIDANQATQTLTAKHSQLYIRNHKIATIPYLSLPLGKARKSGFLAPHSSYSGRSGFSLSVPYYFNLAPNYDDTLTARVLSKRGLQVRNTLRWLDKHTNVNLSTEIVPYDFRYKKFLDATPGVQGWGPTRASLRWQSHTHISRHWRADADISAVSDDDYLRDFHHDLGSISQTQLSQILALRYDDQHWHNSLRFLQYQTLRPQGVTKPASNYAHLPELYLDGFFPQQAGHSDIHWHSEFTHFSWPGNDITRTSGTRLVLAPSMAFPWRRAYGFVIPRAKAVLRHYYLSHPQPATQAMLERYTPILSLDSGLIFDKNWHNAWQQTLEPRLFYLYVPKQAQDTLPLFDTSPALFNFAQLFRDNRFYSYDRLGDANQLSASIVSRLLRASNGRELLRFGIGNIFYFDDRSTAFCRGLNCSKQSQAIRFTSATAAFSPLVGMLNLTLNKHWHTQADAAWSWADKTINNAGVIAHYQYDPAHVLHFNYHWQRYVLNHTSNNNFSTTSAHTIGLAGAWVLQQNWSLLGALSYNLAKHEAQSAYVGAQYDSCCFAMRLLGGHNAEHTSHIHLQILLKGLGAVTTSDPSRMLANDLPGYRDIFKTLK